MPSISFILSTNRTRERVDEIHKIIKSQIDDYEIVCFSPFDPGPGIKWIKEESNSMGGSLGYNVASLHSEGDIILGITDDIIINSNLKKFHDEVHEYYSNNSHKQIYGMVPIERGENFVDIAEMNTISLKYVYPEVPIVFFKNVYPWFKKPCIPCMSQKILRESMHGFLFNPMFKHHYVDCWLGVWMHHNDFGISYNSNNLFKLLESATFWGSDFYDAFVYQFLTDNVSKDCSYIMTPKSELQSLLDRYKPYLKAEDLDKLEFFAIDQKFDMEFHV